MLKRLPLGHSVCTGSARVETGYARSEAEHWLVFWMPVGYSCGMQECLQYVIPLLVDFPEEMAITRHEGNKKATFLLKLRQSDVGKVIGKHGQTIIAIRNLLAAGAARHGEKALLEIVE